MAPRLISWKELGSPTSPCVVHVEGVGNVNIRPHDIAEAATRSRPFFVKLSSDVGHSKSIRNEYLIIGYEPPNE